MKKGAAANPLPAQPAGLLPPITATPYFQRSDSKITRERAFRQRISGYFSGRPSSCHAAGSGAVTVSGS